ncbi:MAG TPA: PEGA domain-containing protein [Firmicutes bacterium]|nr:PEGA domain-containing protein [Candidatus Fermentithermobacillaceae bacterium]
MDAERKGLTKEDTGNRQKSKRLLRGVVGVVVNVALMAVIGAASYYLSSQYFALKRSTVATVLAINIENDRITAYRPASGLLDKYAVSDDSPFISIPLAGKYRFLSKDGKVVGRSDMSVEPGKVKPVTITILPDGTVLKAQEAGDPFLAEGEALWSADGELSVQGTPVNVEKAVFLAFGKTDTVTKEELLEEISPGDLVKVMGLSEEAVLELVEKAGALRVDSNVPGARVYVDGILRGKTPCVIGVAPGERRVAVKANGYKSYETTVTVTSLEETALTPVLDLITGGVNVISDPSGALVFIDGVGKGNAPVTLDLAPGRYEISVEKAGYRTKSLTITVAADRTQDVQVRLTKDSRQSGTVEEEPSFRFSYSGTVMAKDGNRLYVGDAWLACDVPPSARVSHHGASSTLAQVRPGDVVTVRGPSDKDIREVSVDARLYRDAEFEAFLVDGTILFGETGKLQLAVPGNLKVIDARNKRAAPASEVPSGSRILFSLGPSGDIVWAEYVWRAEASLRGRVGLISGAALFVMPRWEASNISMSTNVYLGNSRTSFFDIRQGDTVLVAGPSAQDIRFVRVENRIEYEKTLDCVVTAQSSKQGKVFFERRAIPAGEAYPIVVRPGTEMADLRARVTLSSEELQWGDRAKLYLNSAGEVVWGEVTDTCSDRVTGRYLGEKDGVFYFTGYVPMAMRDDAVIQGLFGSDTLRTGAKVLAGGRDGALKYLEIQENTKPGWSASGTVVSSAKDTLSIWAGDTTSISFARDARFVDWTAGVDGPLTDLFPGDRVTILADSTQTVYWAERTYTPRFKLEGTVTSIQGRVLTVGDSRSSATVLVDAAALVLRDGVRVDLSSVRKGDKVRLSGDSVGSINVVVLGR